MSRYATTADLARFVPAAAIQSVSGIAQQQALDDASNEADGYLASYFKLPLVAWGTDLTAAVCKIAVYNIMALRGFRPDGADDLFRQRYEDALAWLTKVSQGYVTPAGIADSSANVADGAPIVITGQASVFVGGSGFASDPGSPRPYPYVPSGGGKRGW